MSRRQSVRCPVCGADFSSEPAFCSVCGESMVGWNTKPGDPYGFLGTGLRPPRGERRAARESPPRSTTPRLTLVLQILGALLFSFIVQMVINAFRKSSKRDTAGG